jgi:glycosyltransferase involved in cell wall biosynthesis
MKICYFYSDFSGCLQFRVLQPFRALKRFGVDATGYCYLPKYPNQNEFETLVNMVSGYDLIIVQRCYLLEIFQKLRQACDFVGIPLVFETDDDYIHLEPDNPAFAGMIGEDFLKTNPTQQQINEKRQHTLNEYVQIISQADLVTVSTEELKKTLNRFNKNIVVLENQVEQVYEWRSQDPEHLFIKDGGVQIMEKFGFVSIPSYYLTPDGKSAVLTPRVGYTGTPTHRGRDWNTIEEGYKKVIKKLNEKCWFVYIGDPWFNYWHEELKKELREKKPKFGDRNWPISAQPFDMYNLNIRNIDIGMAPVAPTLFNMCKSDLKALELAAWGIPSVLPNYVTYSRHWKHGENCLLYYNAKEFQECMETLINDAQLRMKLGHNALQYVKSSRLESQHAERRYNIYKETIENSTRLKIFKPDR